MVPLCWAHVEFAQLVGLCTYLIRYTPVGRMIWLLCADARLRGVVWGGEFLVLLGYQCFSCTLICCLFLVAQSFGMRQGGGRGGRAHASLVVSKTSNGVAIVGKDQHNRAARRRRAAGRRRSASDRQRRREGSMLLVDAAFINTAFGDAPPQQYVVCVRACVRARVCVCLCVC